MRSAWFIKRLRTEKRRLLGKSLAIQMERIGKDEKNLKIVSENSRRNFRKTQKIMSPGTVKEILEEQVRKSSLRTTDASRRRIRFNVDSVTLDPHGEKTGSKLPPSFLSNSTTTTTFCLLSLHP